MLVTINVGGKLFTTTEVTLRQSLYFDKILSGEKECLRDQSNYIFVDRSPKIFKLVLDFLRDDRYKFPNEYLFELDFYEIPYDIPDPERNWINCHKCHFRKTPPKNIYCDFCIRGMMQI